MRLRLRCATDVLKSGRDGMGWVGVRLGKGFGVGENSDGVTIEMSGEGEKRNSFLGKESQKMRTGYAEDFSVVYVGRLKTGRTSMFGFRMRSWRCLFAA